MQDTPKQITAQDLKAITENAIQTREVNSYVDTFLVEAKDLAEKGEGEHSITITDPDIRSGIVETLQAKGFRLMEERILTTHTIFGGTCSQTTLSFVWQSKVFSF